MEMKAGWQAKSLAGNDRGMIYVIKEDRGEYVFLLADNGKQLRKNKKHVQVIKRTKDDAMLSHRREFEVCPKQM